MAKFCIGRVNKTLLSCLLLANAPFAFEKKIQCNNIIYEQIK